MLLHILLKEIVCRAFLLAFLLHRILKGHFFLFPLVPEYSIVAGWHLTKTMVCFTGTEHAKEKSLSKADCTSQEKECCNKKKSKEKSLCIQVEAWCEYMWRIECVRGCCRVWENVWLVLLYQCVEFYIRIYLSTLGHGFFSVMVLSHLIYCFTISR